MSCATLLQRRDLNPFLPFVRGDIVTAPDDDAVSNFVVGQIAVEEIIAVWRETGGPELAKPVARSYLRTARPVWR